VSRYLAALRLVFGDLFNVVLGVVAGLAALVLLSWAGQLVTTFQYGGLYWDLEPRRVAAILAMSLAVGLVVPVQAEVIRQLRARAIARAAGGLVATSLGGVAAVSCCAPLLIPAIAGLFGASGTTALSLNLRFHRWFVPLMAGSLGMVLLSGASGLRDLVRGCRVATVDDRDPDPDSLESMEDGAAATDARKRGTR